jgi:uncharacterized cupin superfamily protein
VSGRANVFEPRFDADQDRPGFTYRRARIGRQAGAERLGASVYEISPGESTFPYHFQLANEEMLVVLRGEPHLRTPEGWRRLEEGELVAFPVGERGAHQLHNRGNEPARVLVISEMRAPELSFYPDSGKFLAGDRAPGAIADEQGVLFASFRLSDEVDYWEGESPPRSDPAPGDSAPTSG